MDRGKDGKRNRWTEEKMERGIVGQRKRWREE